MRIDRHKDEYGRYVSEDDISYSDAKSFLQCGVLGFCGCGDSEATLTLVRDGLALLRARKGPYGEDPEVDLSYDEFCRLEEELFGNDRSAWLFWYVVDAARLTEHRSSLPGWTTEKGDEVYEDLVAMYGEPDIFQSDEEETFIYFSYKEGFPFYQYNTAENIAVSIYPDGSTGWRARSLESLRERGDFTEVSYHCVDKALGEEARRGPMYFSSDEEPEIAVVVFRGDLDAEVVYSDGGRLKHQWFLWNFVLSEKWAALPSSRAESLIEEAENSHMG